MRVVTRTPVCPLEGCSKLNTIHEINRINGRFNEALPCSPDSPLRSKLTYTYSILVT